MNQSKPKKMLKIIIKNGEDIIKAEYISLDEGDLKLRDNNDVIVAAYARGTWESVYGEVRNYLPFNNKCFHLKTIHDLHKNTCTCMDCGDSAPMFKKPK